MTAEAGLDRAVSASPENSSTRAAKVVENAFDKTVGAGSDAATDALINVINQNPSQASAILKQIGQDDQVDHDNVLPYIALTVADRLLAGTMPGNNDESDQTFNSYDLQALKTNPGGDSPGETALIKMSADYLSANYSEIAGISADAPANADGTADQSSIISLDLSTAALNFAKQPGWNAPQEVYNPTLGVKIFDTIGEFI